MNWDNLAERLIGLVAVLCALVILLWVVLPLLQAVSSLSLGR